MSLASLLARPSLRLPLLAATIAATVATSSPDWSLSDDGAPRPVHLEPGASTELAVNVDASEAPTVELHLEDLAPPAEPGSLEVAASDSRERDESLPACLPSATFASGGGTWKASPERHRATNGGVVYVHNACGTNDARARISFRVTNGHRVPIDFEWRVTARISGSESTDPPDGAFVRVEVVE